MSDNIVKLEFQTKDTKNLIIDFYNSQEIIKLETKTSAKIKDKYITANFRFDININTVQIENIFFINVILVNSNNLENESDNETLDTIENKFYKELTNILNNSVISKNNNTVTVEFKNNTFINYLLMYIFLNDGSIISKSEKENSESDDLQEINSIQTKSSNVVIKKKKAGKDILRLILWSVIMSYVMNIFNTKIIKK